jgi:hypothetical protein
MAATAAMLAARFPYVTPSGHVGECARANGDIAPLDQLVDGGYLENTGLGTINDLSDIWLPQVRKWNTDELQKSQPKLIVPLVAYLDNATGTDKNAPKRDIPTSFCFRCWPNCMPAAMRSPMRPACNGPRIWSHQIRSAQQAISSARRQSARSRVGSTPSTPRADHKSRHHLAGCCPASAGKRSPPRLTSRRLRPA